MFEFEVGKLLRRPVQKCLLIRLGFSCHFRHDAVAVAVAQSVERPLKGLSTKVQLNRHGFESLSRHKVVGNIKFLAAPAVRRT